MQTLAEKVEALRTLLPLVEAHLHLMGGRITTRYQDADETPAPPATPTPPCDGRCFGCRQRCRGEAWEREYCRLRAAYPIVRRLERLLDELAHVDIRWRCGVYYTLVQPWDEYDRARRLEWCECGLEWMAERVHNVPTYELQMHKTAVTADQVAQLHDEGYSIRQISRRLECSKSRVHQLLAAHPDRRERKTYSVS